MDWKTVADQQVLDKTKKALQENGITVHIVEDGKDAKQKVTELLPEQAEVMTMTSITLDQTGITDAINESGSYESVRNKLNSMDRETQGRDMQRIGAAPEWAVGSVHAVTEDGKVIVASNTGSQLPGYTYGADHVIWVVGGQKIVKDIDEGMKRVYEHVLPLESERAHKAYGIPGSNVSKVFILNKEVNPQRITMVLVKESLGF